MEGRNVYEGPEKIEIDGFSYRLRVAMKKSGGFTALMRKAKLSQTSLTNYLKDRKPKIDVAVKIAKACDVSPIWLIFGDEADDIKKCPIAFAQQGASPSDDMQVPFVNDEASAETGLVPAEWDGAEMLSFSRDFMRQLLGKSIKDLFMMRVRGDSMTPTIRPRDVLFVDYAPSRVVPGIYIVSVGDMILAKRLAAKDPWTYSVISDNPIYPPFDVPMKKACWGNTAPEADVRIIGRVLNILHEMDI